MVKAGVLGPSAQWWAGWLLQSRSTGGVVQRGHPTPIATTFVEQVDAIWMVVRHQVPREVVQQAHVRVLPASAGREHALPDQLFVFWVQEQDVADDSTHERAADVDETAAVDPLPVLLRAEPVQTRRPRHPQAHAR